MLEEHFFLSRPTTYFGSHSRNPDAEENQELPEILFSTDSLLLEQKQVGLFMMMHDLTPY